MDLDKIIVEQIKDSKIAEEQRKEEALKKAQADDKREEREKNQAKENQKTFNHQRTILEQSGVRQILNTIVKGLNFSDARYSLLRERIIGIVKVNPHERINYKSAFCVSKPYNFDGLCSRYYIRLNYDDYHNIITFYYQEDNQILLGSDLFQISKNLILFKGRDLMAAQIINFLMTD